MLRLDSRGPKTDTGRRGHTTIAQVRDNDSIEGVGSGDGEK